jgi:hypothetical protein
METKSAGKRGIYSRMTDSMVIEEQDKERLNTFEGDLPSLKVY